MISVLITAFREASTIGPAIEALLPQLPPKGEIIVVCPDIETRAVVENYSRCHPQVRQVTDPQQGKPTAVTMGLDAARGDIVVLTDGDVVVAGNSLPKLIAGFAEPSVGAVCGRPVSRNPRNTVLGYWSHLLADSAHHVRERRSRQCEFIDVSGYLFAVRKHLITCIPHDALSEDAVISQQIATSGYQIQYVSGAQVSVKYPTTYRDWLLQKVRSTGGYAQKYVRTSQVRMRSFWLEMRDGTGLALRYPANMQERAWTLLLFGARLHLWLLVFLRVRLGRRSFFELWKRVETTK